MTHKSKPMSGRPRPSRPRKAAELQQARLGKAPGALRRAAEAHLGDRPSGGSHPTTKAEPERLQHELEVHQVELEMQNKELQRALAEREAALDRYTDFYDFTPAGYLTLKPDGTIQQANLTLASWLGIERTRLLKRRFGAFVAADSRSAFAALLVRAFDSPAPVVGEVGLVVKGKPPLTIQLCARISEDGQECRVVLMDITERKRVETALGQSEVFAKSVLDALAAHIAVVDEQGTIMAVNEAWRRFARENDGDPAAYVGANYLAVCEASLEQGPDPMLEEMLQGLRDLLHGEREEFWQEYPCHSHAEQRWFCLRGTRFPGEGSVRVVVVHENITQRKLAEERLCENEAAARARADELAAILAATPAITFIAHDRECRHMTSSSAALRLLRLPDGANTSKSAPPGERPGTFRALKDGRELRPEELPVQRAAATGQAVHDAELTLAFANGKTRTIVGNAVPVFDAQGKLRGAVGTFLDMTERKQIMEALRLTNAYNRSLIEASLDALVVIGPDGRITDVNRTTEILTDRTRQELIGTDFSDCFTDPEKARAGYQQVFREGSVRNYPLELRHRDGHTTPVHYNASGYRDETGKVIGIFAAARDITERKRAEQELRQLSARLLQLRDEERRHLARELHDSTVQDLAAVMVNLSFLRTAAPRLKPEARQALLDSQLLVERSATGLRTLTYLLHPPLLEELGLAGAVRDFAAGFARRSGIRVDLELALFRIVQESLANVHRHAGSDSARITFKQTADEVCLEVRDAGHGFVPKVPKSDGPAPELGVGIPGMRERLRRLGGRLEVTSNSDGTIVRATLPYAQAKSSNPP